MIVPEWKIIGEEIAGKIFQAGMSALAPNREKDPDFGVLPELALYHIQACLNESINASRCFQPAVAICLLRQCVEALTIVDVGLQPKEFRVLHLKSWREGNSTAGSLRKGLASYAWPKYGNGLWEESWEEYFSNLAKAVHPYAHYSVELLGWQMGLLTNNETGKKFATTGYTNSDPLKLTRLALLQSIVIWTLGRILAATSNINQLNLPVKKLDNLGSAIGRSDLLFKSKQWADELLPHVWFESGKSWKP